MEEQKLKENLSEVIHNDIDVGRSSLLQEMVLYIALHFIQKHKKNDNKWENGFTITSSFMIYDQQYTFVVSYVIGYNNDISIEFQKFNDQNITDKFRYIDRMGANQFYKMNEIIYDTFVEIFPFKCFREKMRHYDMMKNNNWLRQ